MPDQEYKQVDYKAVLENLRARKAAIEQAIAALEPFVAELSESGVIIGVATKPSKTVEADTFIGLNIVQASEKYLQMAGRPARPLEEIANALNEGGLQVTQASVSTILRRSERNDSPVVRIGRGLWGLASWYPNRPRRVRQGGEEAQK
jgi:hypothetical protein